MVVVGLTKSFIKINAGFFIRISLEIKLSFNDFTISSAAVGRWR